MGQTIALVSDLNGRYGSTTYDSRVSKAVSTIIALNPLLVISTGDMVAGQKQPQLDGPHLDRMWQGFNQHVTDPLAKAEIPLAVTPGNHDGSGYPQFELEQVHFSKQWQERYAGLEILPGSEWPRRYAARLNDFLLISFDGTKPGTLPEQELDFVANMLEKHRPSAKAVIVFSHLPMWPLARGREHEILDDSALLDLLHRFDVDVYASGHHHLFYPGVDEGGMIHLGIGALGGNARAFSGSATRQPHSFAVLQFEDGALRVKAFSAPAFASEIERAGLPPEIKGSLGTLKRLD